MTMFQFSTGWNSTCAYRLWAQRQILVSIPNGMEFYWENSKRNIWSNGSFQFPTGWNSTLRLAPPQQFLFLRVSIPNGMEFYQTARSTGFKPRCFNSQRDGILQCWAQSYTRTAYVSIPNGMEFYYSDDLKGFHKQLFQFPTGWNST